MNIGSPTQSTDDKKDQVKLNQPPPPPTPSPQAVPPVTPSPTPGSTPTPAPPAPSPPTTGATPAEDKIGVGNPKIGVELEEKKPDETAKISVSSPKIEIPGQKKEKENVPPPTSPPPAPKSPPSDEGKIEASTTDIPIKTYDRSRTNEQPTTEAPKIPVSPTLVSQPAGPGEPPPPAGGAPIKTRPGSPATTIIILAILALIIGASGGFFGFRYWDRLKTLASETKVSPSPSSATGAAEESPSLDVNLWSTYSSTLYNFSLKYPNGWLASTTSPTAEEIVFAANNESLAGALTGFRIEINFQDANGKTLKSWVEANAVATNEKNAAKEIIVDSHTAYQQELTNNQPAIATYLSRGEKIMIVTYTAPAEEMGDGGAWYNNLINSIKLM